MELINVRTIDFQFKDNRGSLTQLVRAGFEQINVLITEQGVTRGGHYHKLATEAFYIICGSVEVTIKSLDEEQRHVFHAGEFFEIKPNVIHYMYFPEYCIMVQMYDTCIEMTGGDLDIYPQE